jgi:hypothetical protein
MLPYLTFEQVEDVVVAVDVLMGSEVCLCVFVIIKLHNTKAPCG